MSQLVVRNLESALVLRLKQQAAEHGISAEEEHRRILRRALSDTEEDFPDLKGLLLAMPRVGEDEDFARLRQFPPDLDLS
jgi:antitoxin FitA